MAAGNRARVDVRPIELTEIDRIPLRCWPDGPTLERLFAEQGTIGMATWEGDRCVAQLHCYEVRVPDRSNEHWTHGGNWWDPSEQERVFTDFQWWG